MKEEAESRKEENMVHLEKQAGAEVLYQARTFEFYAISNGKTSKVLGKREGWSYSVCTWKTPKREINISQKEFHKNSHYNYNINAI